ncbi:MAG: methylamine utilization protein [Aureliella sp.]
MKHKLSMFALTALVGICSAAAASADDWATLKLKVVYDGPAPKLKPLDGTKEPFCAGLQIPDARMVVGPKGELANFGVVMDMRKSEATAIHPDLANPPEKPLVIDNKKCVFLPRVAFAYAGQKVIVTNNDPCGHNYKVDPFSNDSVNMLVPIGGQIEVEFKDGERSNFTEFTCTIHPWMKGQLIIRDHPYVGISGTDGVVTIEKLPVGEVTFKLVHENMKKSIDEGKLDGKKDKWRSGYIEFELKPGMNEHTLTLDPDLFED